MLTPVPASHRRNCRNMHVQAAARALDELHAKLAHAAGTCVGGGSQQEAGEAQEQHGHDLIHTLQGLTRAVEEQQQRLRTTFADAERQAAAGLQEAVARLQLELGSAGNIWLEEAQPGTPWLAGCQQLLRDRAAADAPAAGVRVLAAVRIHNRHLRAQFSQLGAQAGGSTAAEQLFAAAHGTGALMAIAQHGFDASMGGAAAITLASCLDDVVWQEAGNGPRQVLVCRALVGRCVQAACEWEASGCMHGGRCTQQERKGGTHEWRRL
jgi:hypothetical protein